MKHRLYFLLPSVETAKDMIADLLLSHVQEKNIHIVAKDHHLLHQHELPEAGLMQERDIVPALEKGVAMGGATGLIAGILAVSIPGVGLALGGGAIAATTVAGAGFGAIMAPMIGISAPNDQIKAYEDAVDQGQLLMLVDVPKERIDEVTAIIARHHPEVDVRGAEPKKLPY